MPDGAFHLAGAQGGAAHLLGEMFIVFQASESIFLSKECPLSIVELLRGNAKIAFELLAEIVGIVETAQLSNSLNLKLRCFEQLQRSVHAQVSNV